MGIRINPNYCVACNKWEWSAVLVKFGAYFYHQSCLDRLRNGLVKPDKAMLHKLSKAFDKVHTEEV